MIKLLASCLVALASAASAATPLENAALIAAQLGAKVSAPEAIKTPAAAPAARPAAVRLAVSPAAVKTTALAGTSGSISGYVNASGNGSMMCNGSMMSGWINLTANVSVTTDDGANAQFPVSGNVYLSGSCQGNGGFVSGSAMMTGYGSLYKAGRYVGTVNLSGNSFISQYVNAPFAWINQSVYVSGYYTENAAAAK
jgi:hypothetical protein